MDVQGWNSARREQLDLSCIKFSVCASRVFIRFWRILCSLHAGVGDCLLTRAPGTYDPSSVEFGPEGSCGVLDFYSNCTDVAGGSDAVVPPGNERKERSPPPRVEVVEAEAGGGVGEGDLGDGKEKGVVAAVRG